MCVKLVGVDLALIRISRAQTRNILCVFWHFISQDISRSGSIIQMVSKLAGIVFYRTTMLGEIVDFYVNEIGMHIWLEQEDCTILSHGNLLLGFCDRDTAELDGLICFFYPEKEDVDTMYRMLEHITTSEPAINERYQIYHFFAEDPEGRALEFQAFLHPVEPIGF